MSHQQSFSYKGTGLPGLNQYKARINVHAQGHNAVMPVRLEPAAPLSRVKHSTTEPLRSKMRLDGMASKCHNFRIPNNDNKQGVCPSHLKMGTQKS